jgi:hypothetical protein
MKRKTATIARLPIYGTPYHALNLMYRGYCIWQEIDRCGIDAGKISPRDELARVAKIEGFTHWRFTGDWHKRTKPRGGSIKGRDE